jgi:uncharacterized membrane-anchored protein
MSVIRYLVRAVVMFAVGMVSFFALLIAVAGIICLLVIGAACALFTLWAAMHLFFYLALHDRAEGRNAFQAILVAAGCFAIITLASSVVTDLFVWARRPKLSLAFNAPAPAHDPALRAQDR